MSSPRVVAKNTIVEMDGDEMTRDHLDDGEAGS